MDNFEWGYFVLGVIAFQLIKMLALTFNRWAIERRQQQFLKLVRVTFPDNKKIELVSVDSSDKRAFQKLERQIREEYGVPDLPKPVTPSPMKSQ